MCIFLLLAISILLQAADQSSDYIKRVDASYDRLISVDYASYDIDTADQIILPVSHGQHITLPLETEDVFSCDSVRNMIKEARDADIFYILACYRAKQLDGASHIKCACGDGFLEYVLGDKTEDPLTRLPIVKADFHEFCYIDKKLAARYLGSGKDLGHQNNVLLILSVSNPRQNEFNSHVSVMLSQVHTKKGDFERARKYIKTIPKGCVKKYRGGILDIASFAIKQHHDNVAIQVLEKIDESGLHVPLLLHKLNNNTDQESLCTLSANIIDSLEGDPQARFDLGHAYLQEAMSSGFNTDMGIKFLIAATCHYQIVARRQANPYAMFALFQALSIMHNADDHLRFTSKQELEDYANQCIDIINTGNSAHAIVQMKEKHPLDYEKVMELLKKYGTMQIITE